MGFWRLGFFPRVFFQTFSVCMCKVKNLHNQSILGPWCLCWQLWLPCLKWAHLPGVIQRLLAGSRGWPLHLVAVVWDGRAPLRALSQVQRPDFNSHWFLIAFEQEVNKHTCATFVLLHTPGTGCPSPASEPCELSVGSYTF